MAQVSPSLRPSKSRHRLTEVTRGLCPRQPPVQVPAAFQNPQLPTRNWARHPPFFPKWRQEEFQGRGQEGGVPHDLNSP